MPRSLYIYIYIHTTHSHGIHLHLYGHAFAEVSGSGITGTLPVYYPFKVPTVCLGEPFSHVSYIFLLSAGGGNGRGVPARQGGEEGAFYLKIRGGGVIQGGGCTAWKTVSAGSGWVTLLRGPNARKKCLRTSLNYPWITVTIVFLQCWMAGKVTTHVLWSWLPQTPPKPWRISKSLKSD